MFENSVNSAGNETTMIDTVENMMFENSVNSAGNETDRALREIALLFENSVNSAGNETGLTSTGDFLRLRTLLILQVMKLMSVIFSAPICLRTLLILQVMKRTPDLDNLDEMFENSVNSAGNETDSPF